MRKELSREEQPEFSDWAVSYKIGNEAVTTDFIK